MKLQLQLFSKAPLPGAVKTRLIPALGAEGAAQLQQRMTAAMVERAVASGLGEVVLYCTPDPDHPAFIQLQQRYGISLRRQQGGEIGARMAAAITQGLEAHDAVLLMGCDAPGLEQALLRTVVEQLQQHEVVLVPAADGGYVLVAMRRLVAAIFSGVAWGSDSVLSQTEAILRREGVRWSRLPCVRDIDRPEDLDHLPAGWLEPDAA